MKDPYTGQCFFFVRINTNKAVTNVNIHQVRFSMGVFHIATITYHLFVLYTQEVHFGMLESNGEGLLGAIEKLLGSIFIPALQQSEKWGELSGAQGQRVKQQFLGKLSSFVAVLANAQASIADAARLTPCDHPGLSSLSTPSEILAASGNSALIEVAESYALKWCREIEQVGTHTPYITLFLIIV